MDIAIIGAGVVGQATGKGLARFGHKITFIDDSQKVVEKLKKEGYNAKPVECAVTTPREFDVIFICVPEDVIDSEQIHIWKFGYKSEFWVIRSTVPVGTCKHLYTYIHGHEDSFFHLCHNPEFLRESLAEFEFLNPKRIVIGECCVEAGDMLERLYKPFNVPIIRTDTNTSEMVKLVSNAYLATQISFWNQIDLIADKLNLNSHVIARILTLDTRVSKYGAHMHSKKYGGVCLPKDLAQLKLIAMKKRVTTILLDAVKEINENIELLKGVK